MGALRLLRLQGQVWWFKRDVPAALAYNLTTFLRCIELPEPMANCSLSNLQLKLIKIGARVVLHARVITFQLAEVADRPDGSRHPSSHPLIASAIAVRMSAIQAKTQQKRLYRAVCRAGKRGHRASMMRVRGMIRPTPGVLATVDALRRAKPLISRPFQANLTPNGRPLGECRQNPQSSFLLSS